LPRDTLKFESMQRLASYFRALADENRLRILNLLFHGELCGCDVQYVLGASQSTISRHLSYLKNAGLVQDRRVGYRVFYRMVYSEDVETTELWEYLVMAFAKDRVLKADMKKLREAIKEGACTVTEWKPLSGLASSRPLREGA
jgi:ArsR family transcriptional regulator